MKSNPCIKCDKAFVYKNRHIPQSFGDFAKDCAECDKRKAHAQYLESQRKYYAGNPITTLEELLNQKWVMWGKSIRHIEVIKCLQLSTILKLLSCGAFREAIRKEE